MKSVIATLCILLGLAGCQSRIATDVELARKYTYIFIDSGFSLALSPDHTYVYDFYSPFTISDPAAKPAPPKEVGIWKAKGLSVVLKANTGAVRQLEITRREGNLALIERKSKTVNWIFTETAEPAASENGDKSPPLS